MKGDSGFFLGMYLVFGLVLATLIDLVVVIAVMVFCLHRPRLRPVAQGVIAASVILSIGFVLWGVTHPSPQ